MTEQINRAGDTVTYHGDSGDLDAVVVRFASAYGATLRLDDGTELARVHQGSQPRQWEPRAVAG